MTDLLKIWGLNHSQVRLVCFVEVRLSPEYEPVNRSLHLVQNF